MKFFEIFKGFALNADTAESLTPETETAAEGIGSLISFSTANLPMTLKHMGIGMLSIFIVIGVIILCIYALNKIMNSLEARKQNKE